MARFRIVSSGDVWRFASSLLLLFVLVISESESELIWMGEPSSSSIGATKSSGIASRSSRSTSTSERLSSRLPLLGSGDDVESMSKSRLEKMLASVVGWFWPMADEVVVEGSISNVK